jgi:protein ImuA
MRLAWITVWKYSTGMDSPLAASPIPAPVSVPVPDALPRPAPGPLAAWPVARNRAAHRWEAAACTETPHPGLRRGDRPDAVAEAGVAASGFAALDAQLPDGGWPRRALTELLLPHAGVGEMRLLAPVLVATVQAGRLVMLFDPPASLSAWALAELGLDAQQLLVIDGRSPVLPDASSLWAIEQALKSGQVGAVLAWLPPRLRAERLRRLQWAAQQHDGPAFVLRETAARDRPTAAPLRLALQAAGADRLALRILKRRGPPPGGVLQIELPPPRLPVEMLRASRRIVASSKLSGVLDEASRAGARAAVHGDAPGLASLPSPVPAHAPVAGQSSVARSAVAEAAFDAARCTAGFDRGCDDAVSDAAFSGAPAAAAFHAALHAPLHAAVFVDFGG